MLFSTYAEFVRCLVNSLESELDRVFHLCNICDRLGGQLGVRISYELVFFTCAAFGRCLVNSLESELGGVFHLCSICEMFGEQFGIRIRWCFPPVQHLWQVWWSAWRKISMVFLSGICGSCGGRPLVVCTPCQRMLSLTGMKRS